MNRTKARIDLGHIGLLIVGVSVVLSLAYPLLHRQVIRFLELYLSSDHQITPNGERQFISMYYLGTVMLLGVGLALLKGKDASWRAEMSRLFLEDPLRPSASAHLSPRIVLILSSLVGLALILTMRLSYRFPHLHLFLYAKDQGLLDLFVPATTTISALLLGLAVWRQTREHKVTDVGAFPSLVYLSLMGLLLVYAGEETSWGQDFFRWQTPAVFSGNLEGQTNIHNYFNPYFDYAYIALSLVLVIVLVSAWLESGRLWLLFNRLILPHPSLVGLSSLIAFVAIVWYREQELLEEMMAVFVLFYAIRIFVFSDSHGVSTRA